jgi:carbamoyltransferase
MNVKIKFRESFRPFAPVVLRERVADYFEMAPGTDSPSHVARGAGAR